MCTTQDGFSSEVDETNSLPTDLSATNTDYANYSSYNITKSGRDPTISKNSNTSESLTSNPTSSISFHLSNSEDGISKTLDISEQDQGFNLTMSQEDEAEGRDDGQQKLMDDLIGAATCSDRSVRGSCRALETG